LAQACILKAKENVQIVMDKVKKLKNRIVAKIVKEKKLLKVTESSRSRLKQAAQMSMTIYLQGRMTNM
jgi:hypothetical protein